MFVPTRRRLLRITATTLASAAALITAGSASAATFQPNRNPQPDTTTVGGTVLYGSLPPIGTPAQGGTITIGQQESDTPNWFFPIATGADSGTQNVELASNLFMPLYAAPNGAQPEINFQTSLAAALPVASNGDRTYTIRLNSGYRWADGKPITATDVVFGYDLVRGAVDESEDNWGQYVPGEFPENVASVKAIGTDSVQFNLTHAVNPSYFLYDQIQDTNWGIYAMPSTVWNVTAANQHVSNWQGNAKVDIRIYNYLDHEAGEIKTWTTNPLWKDVDGPYRLSAFNLTTSAYTLTPNPDYSGAAKPTASVNVETFTSLTAELDAFKEGYLDISAVGPSQLNQAKDAGGTLYGGPGFGWFAGIYNFKDTTDDFDHVIAQDYVRQAIARLDNEPAILSDVYRGTAVPQYTPVPSAPTSSFDPKAATTPLFPYDPAAAVALLKQHGWNVKPGGQTTCAKPGKSASECGAGIPKGTPIKFVWANPPASASTTAVGESEALASTAKKYAGIDIELTVKTENFLFQAYDDTNPADKKYENDWGVNNVGGVYTDYDPTAAGIWTPGGGFNFGDYDNAEENQLVELSETSSNPLAPENEMTYLAEDPPVVYFPDLDNLYLVSKQIGASQTGYLALTQQQFEPQYFYRVK